MTEEANSVLPAPADDGKFRMSYVKLAGLLTNAIQPEGRRTRGTRPSLILTALK